MATSDPIIVRKCDYVKLGWGQADPRFSNHIIWRFFDKIRGMISKKLLFRTLFALLLLAGLLGLSSFRRLHLLDICHNW